MEHVERSASRGERRTVSGVDRTSMPHTKARTQHPEYPQRYALEDSDVAWDIQLPGYAPVDYVHPVVLSQNSEVNPKGWADPPEPRHPVIEARGSHELQARGLPWSYDDKGRPINPRGRTGLCNRGLLGKWGPNHAGDAIVTRHRRRTPTNGQGKPSDGALCLEMVAIKRRDTGEWAIPGGMADPSEVGKASLMREFKEEAGNVSEEHRARFDQLVNDLFADSNGRVVYRGYVDDPRNTDNAWMETIAMRTRPHEHDEPSQLALQCLPASPARHDELSPPGRVCRPCRPAPSRRRADGRVGRWATVCRRCSDAATLAMCLSPLAQTSIARRR